MNETVDSAKRAVSSVDLALSAVGLLKSLALIFGVVLIEYARKKQKLAENAAAVSKSNLDLQLTQGGLENELREKGADAVIDELLGNEPSIRR